MIFLMIIAAAAVCIIEGVYLLRNNMRKEFIVVCILLIVPIFIQIGFYFGITSAGVFEKLLEPIGRMLFKKI